VKVLFAVIFKQNWFHIHRSSETLRKFISYEKTEVLGILAKSTRKWHSKFFGAAGFLLYMPTNGTSESGFGKTEIILACRIETDVPVLNWPNLVRW
jgi:intein-encoded DNA endonuclease-like protein